MIIAITVGLTILLAAVTVCFVLILAIWLLVVTDWG